MGVEADIFLQLVTERKCQIIQKKCKTSSTQQVILNTTVLILATIQIVQLPTLPADGCLTHGN